MFYVDGEPFRTQTEYDLALKDKEIIDELKSEHDIKTASGIKELYAVLKDVHFSTSVGDKFDDYIFELYEKVKNGEITDAPASKGKKNQNKKTGDSFSKSKQESFKVQERGHSGNDKKLDPAMKAEIVKEIKRRNRRRTILVVSLVLIAVLSLGYYGFYYKAAHDKDAEADRLNELKDPKFADIINVTPETRKDYDEEVVIPEILDEYKVLYNKNKSLIGWIKIADTIIDYPVMQASDNEYYLKYNFEQKKDANGCIFLDTNCDVILGNTNWILYGHHMNNGKMFSSLIKYANKDFYEKHKIIEFDTIYEKGTYEVMYAFRSRVYSSDKIVFKYYQFLDAYSAEEFDSYMEEMDKLSLIDTGVTAVYGDKLLTLSTCDYQEQNGRFVVVAKRIN